jgi:glycosyltransferase involved in cell wall biosynthesis
MLRRRSQHDVAIVTGDYTGFAFAGLQRLVPGRRLPTVFVECNWYRERRSWRRPLKYWQMRFCLKAVDRCVVWAEREIKAYSEEFGVEAGKFVFVPQHNSLHPHRYSFTVREGDYIFGAGNYDRDFGTFVEAVRFVNCPCVIACKPDRLPKGVELPPHVRQLWATPEEFRQLMAGSMFVVVPMEAGLLHSGGQQGFVNGMALGKAVVVSDPGGASSYIEHGVTGLLVPPANPSALREAIEKLLANPGLREEIGQRAREVAQNWTVQNIYDRICAMADEIARPQLGVRSGYAITTPTGSRVQDVHFRILQVASGMPGWSGTERHILDISPALERRGHHVTIACRPNSEIERRALAIGLPVVHLETRRAHDWRQLPRFFRAIIRGQYDVVHIHSYRDYIVPAAAARLVRAPVVVMTRHLPHPFRNAFTAYVCSQLFYDGIIAVSDFIRGVLLASHVRPDRIVVVKNGIDPGPWQEAAGSRIREELGISPSAFVVGAAGKLWEGKGFDLLVRAVASARRRGVDAVCMIAGSGEERVGLERLSRELSVESAVHLLGFRCDVPAIFSAADAVAVPSSTIQDAFPYTVLEGLASGRPVIATRVGGIPEMLTEDAGYLTSPFDAEGIAGAIAELAGDAEKRFRMGKKALQRAQEFPLDACVRGIEAAYETLWRKLPIAASSTELVSR